MDIRRLSRPLFRLLLCVFVLAALFGLVSAPASAQDTSYPTWRQIPAASLGIASPRSIGFDAAGRAWIGGQGQAVTLLPDGSVAARSAFPAATIVTAIAADPSGAIWLATDGPADQAVGVRAIYPDATSRDYGVADGIADAHVRDLAVSANGDLWLATAGGLGHRARDGGWGRFTQAEGLIHDDVYAVALDRAGNLWIGALAGLSHLSAAGKWQNEALAGPSSSAAWIYSLAVDSQDNLWCATDVGVSVRSPDGAWRTMISSAGTAAQVWPALAADALGGVWIAGGSGLAYHAASGQWARYDAGQAGLIETPITGLAIDGLGRLWCVGPAGVSILLRENAAPDETTATANAGSSSPTAADADPTLTRDVQPVSAPLIEPRSPTGLNAFFEDYLSSGPISRTAFVIIFYAILALAALGVLTLLFRIVRRARRQDDAQTDAVRRPSGSADRSEDEVLLPAQLIGDEPMAPEVEAGLAEPNGYADHGDSLSHIPLSAAQSVTTFQADPLASAAGSAAAPTLTPPPLIDLRMHLRQATVGDVPALLQAGQDLARAGKKADAYDLFSTVTRLLPDHAEAWMWKGATALHPQESVRCLQKAVELAPDNLKARDGLNWALSALAAGEAPGDDQEDLA